MVQVKHLDRELKGDPIGELAGLTGLEGHLTRTKVLGEAGGSEETVAAISAGQAPDGSWNESIVETAGNIGELRLYGVSPRRQAIRAARKWLLARQVAEHPVWQDMFVEPGVTDKRTACGKRLKEQYVRFHPHVAPDFCCAVNPVTSTCCVLEALFAAGDDVSSSQRLAAALNRLLALGHRKGVCAAYFPGSAKEETEPLPKGDALWNRKDLRVFRRPRETNPGVTICAHFVMRAVARSTDLASSPLVKNTLAAWQSYQLENGNFSPNYHQSDFYHALDTLRLFSRHAATREMVVKMLPGVLRRQKRDGRWWRKDDWVHPTFTAIWTLHTFGLLA